MKIISKTILPIFLSSIMLVACNGFTSIPTTSPTNVMETAMSVVKTAVVETQVAIPTITPSSQPPTPISPTPIPPTQTPYFPVPFDNHDPEAVLRAYFDAWNRNDFVTTASIDGGFGGEPVEYIHILKISLISPPSSTECTFNVLFEIKVKGQGVSMHSGNYGWTYTLTWNANRGIWLITNHGAG